MSALSWTSGSGWVGRSLARTAALLPRREDWSHARPGRDLTAGLMVGLVALPLALGFGESSGMGAGAGLVTAVVAGALAAIFGGSRVQVSGPTGAMTVVLVPIIATHGADGVLVVGLLAGLILIGLGYAGLGRFIRYVPIPVVEGFTVGIALIIGLQQLPAALGVQVHAEKVLVLAFRSVQEWLADPVWVPVAMTAAVVAASSSWPGSVPVSRRRWSPSSWPRSPMPASTWARPGSATSRRDCPRHRCPRCRSQTSTR